MIEKFVAHTLPGHPEKDWQSLPDHLTAVAKRAGEMAAAFGASDWAHTAGLWHDLGKYSLAFQNYLRAAASNSTPAGVMEKIDHSSAGAQHAVDSLGILGHLLAYPIASHHAGLLDGHSAGACLKKRLSKSVEPWLDHAPDELIAPLDLKLPSFLDLDEFSIAFFVRMIFSCLVDADSLDTEAFVNQERSKARSAWPSDVLACMESALTAYIQDLESTATQVNIERTRVREMCLASVEADPGLFSLTVPTGGGKTLSSLAFALKHAQLHGLERIIYVIPFTSIIEQTAEVFRLALLPLRGQFPDPVIEHHSNLDIGTETQSSRLASENWDAPIVVTTSVQFYESMFAARTSRSRKLHNLAKSVIVLDEVQTIPVDYLKPCIRAVNELASNYGTTVVLCTATQPALQHREDFPIGLSGIKEIVRDRKALYSRLKRVIVKDIGSVDDEALSQRMNRTKQVLCVVNTRRHARLLFEAIGSDQAGHFHMSALMCPAHRTQVLRSIKAQLNSGRTCRVVSTQLVEAGVDLDFPIVYRSLAGIDSIAQAAGRCNRNGKSSQGETFVFRSEHTEAERYVADTANCASQLLPIYEDILSLEAVEHYFRLYYWEQSTRWDARNILGEFNLDPNREFPFLFNYSTVADRFKLIEDHGKPVIVPWEHNGKSLCKKLRNMHHAPCRQLLRKLQRYTVRIHQRQWENQIGKTIEFVHDQFPVLADPSLHYSSKTGLDLDRSLVEALVI